MIENNSNTAMFSTSIQNMVIDEPLHLIQDTLKEYLEDTNNYTNINGGNNYLSSILEKINMIKNEYNLSADYLKDDVDNVEDLALNIVLKAYTKEFSEEMDSVLAKFNSKTSLIYFCEIFYDIFYSRRVEFILEFLKGYMLTKKSEIISRYKMDTNLKELSFLGLKNSLTLPTKDDYIFIVQVKDVMKDILGSPELFKPNDLLLYFSDIDEEQLTTLNYVLEDNLNFSKVLFDSILNSEHYHFIENSLKQQLIKIIQQHSQ